MSMRGCVEVQGSWAVPALAIAAALVSPNAQAAPLSFKDAQLGMTLAEWRSLAPPEGAGADALPACSDDPRIVTRAYNPLSATLRASDVVDCGYEDLFGQTALPHSILLDARYRANDLQYRFIRGRLAEIRFEASIDAYNDVTAMLEHQYGPPNKMTRDFAHNADGRSARVTQTWWSPSGEIMLVDPSDDPTQLQVSMTAPDGGQAHRAIASPSDDRSRRW